MCKIQTLYLNGKSCNTMFKPKGALALDARGRDAGNNDNTINDDMNDNYYYYYYNDMCIYIYIYIYM